LTWPELAIVAGFPDKKSDADGESPSASFNLRCLSLSQNLSLSGSLSPIGLTGAETQGGVVSARCDVRADDDERSEWNACAGWASAGPGIAP